MNRRGKGNLNVWVMGMILLLPAVGFAEEQERVLSLAQCTAIALRQSPDLIVEQEEVQASIAARNSARGALGPKLRLEANIIRWDGAQQASFGDIPGMPLQIPPFTVREAMTTTVGVSLIQPLSSLWTIYEGYKMRSLGVEAATSKRAISERDVAQRVAEAYYRVLQAARMIDVSRTSVEQLEAQVKRAQSFFNNGVVGQNDLLRAELGLASARQRLIQSRGSHTLARSQLAFAMGLPPDVVIQPVEAKIAAPQGGTISIFAAERSALHQRAELREIEARLDQTQAGVRVAWSRMVPQINFLARYEKNAGSSFQPEHAYYAGLFASWDLWEWGSTSFGIPEARARRRQVETARERLRDAIRLEVRVAHVSFVTTAEALQVAERAVGQAEENYRLEQKRYEAQASTSFDVVDAESQLTGARSLMQTALYDVLIARTALERAMGNSPGDPRTPLAINSIAANTIKEGSHAGQ